MEIKLPNMMWFRNSILNLTKDEPKGNLFTGSYGTDPARGATRKKLLNFSIQLTKFDAERTEFVVESHVLHPWQQSRGGKAERTDHETINFPGVEESIQAIREYLLERAHQLGVC